MPKVAWTLIICLLAGQAPADTDSLDPDRIGWSRVNLKATRLFMSMHAEIRIEQSPADAVTPSLREPGRGNAVMPAAAVVDMNYVTEGLGRQTDVTLLMDPHEGYALQRVSLDSGNKQRFRVYRFTDIGAWHDTRWPVDGEESLQPESWTEHSEGLRPYPDSVAGNPITEPTGLIYIAAASPLAKPGDRMEILTFARRHVHRVTLEVAEPETLPVEYREITAAGARTRKEKIQPVRILIRGQAVEDEDEEDEFDLLGLRGDIELLLDPETRLPLRLSGNVRIVGRVKFAIEQAVLRTP